MYYTEQDSERVRQMEQSSAGASTQRLGELPADMVPIPPAIQPAANRSRQLGGLLLIGLGAIALLMQMFGNRIDMESGVVLFTIASCFLFFAFWKRVYGLLIPGCILAGLAIGTPFADLTDGASVLFGLSLGFLSILTIGRAMFAKRSSWPIFPAVPLFAVGVITLASNAGIFSIATLLLPVLLIAAGLILGARK